MKLYTKGGDKGKTSLIGGERVAKTDERVEAYGSVDELTAFLALLGDSMAEKDADAEYVADIHRINSILMGVEALLAVGEGGQDKVKPVSNEQTEWLEKRIDELQSRIAPITNFTIPGGCSVVSMCHVSRTVCRRAERAAIRAAQSQDIDTSALIFLNRLSDYLYALGRVLTEFFEVEEILWRP
ncbi:MAG: cob(I)yrinic acid a,c-diamide adenosyltransferase [Alistipes sp.]|nr:cob(I)yrinic acid a,c-diamide adenosyltransferase [Alistipes sp.]